MTVNEPDNSSLWYTGAETGHYIDDKNKAPTQDVFEEWPLLMDHFTVTKINLPPARVRLSDWHIWKILDAKVTAFECASNLSS